MIELSEEDWEKQYLPIPNVLRPDEDTNAFETYGDELEFVLEQHPNLIWTELDGDNGTYIVNGYRLVNRIQYYITHKPWKDGEDISITICEYATCDCQQDDTDYYTHLDGTIHEGEPDEDCEKCEGTGQITKWGWEG